MRILFQIRFRRLARSRWSYLLLLSELMVLVVLSGVCFSQTARPSAAQSTAAGTASIVGTVKLGDEPAAGISLALMPDQGGRMAPPQPAGAQPQKTSQAVTNDKGQYQFTNVAAGRYRVTLLSETLVAASGDMRSSGVAVTVSDGQVISQVDFAMARGGVITGRVTDYQNRPAIAERIGLMTLGANGQPQPFNGGNRFSYETDDRGVYRIYGLPPGQYWVSAGTDGNNNRPGLNRRVRYPRTYYPEATDIAQAQAVEVSSGNVAEGIDIRMGGPLKTYAVSGRAVDADTGQPVLNVPINIGGQRGGGPQGMRGAVGGNNTATNNDGEFRIKGLLPGKYSISVKPPGVKSSDSVEVSSDFYNDPANFEIIDDDVSGVEVKVHRGVTLSGVVVIEGGNDPALAAALPQMMISAVSRGGQTQGQGRGQGGGSGRQSAAQVAANGAFTVSGLAPGTVRLNVNGFGGPGGGAGRISLIRIERNGAAINGDVEVGAGEQVTGIRVVVGYGTGAIQGRVVIAGGALPAGARLMVTARPLSSAGSAGGQNRPGQVDATGNFRIEGLLSGSYEVRVTATSFGGFGGQGPGGGQGRGGQRGGGGGGNRTPIKIPDVRQTVNVTNGAQATVTLNLDLSQQ